MHHPLDTNAKSPMSARPSHQPEVSSHPPIEVDCDLDWDMIDIIDSKPRIAKSILIASSACADPHSGIVPRDKMDDLEKGNLMGTVNDCAAVRTLFLSDRKIAIQKMFVDVYDPKPELVKNEIQKLFDDGDVSDKVLYYSGHGQIFTGNWCFQDEKESTHFISPEEIFTMWKNRRNSTSCQRLFVISDSCFSGIWVNEAPKTSDIHVQASCGPHETCSDSKEGGLFTRLWVSEGHDKKSGWNYLNPLVWVSAVVDLSSTVFKKWSNKFTPVSTAGEDGWGYVDVGETSLFFRAGWLHDSTRQKMFV